MPFVPAGSSSCVVVPGAVMTAPTFCQLPVAKFVRLINWKCLPAPLCQLTVVPFAAFVRLWIFKNDAALVGFVPARYSEELMNPSPSGSAVGAALAEVNGKKYFR